MPQYSEQYIQELKKKSVDELVAMIVKNGEDDDRAYWSREELDRKVRDEHIRKEKIQVDFAAKLIVKIQKNHTF